MDCKLNRLRSGVLEWIRPDLRAPPSARNFAPVHSAQKNSAGSVRESDFVALAAAVSCFPRSPPNDTAASEQEPAAPSAPTSQTATPSPRLPAIHSARPPIAPMRLA